MRRAARATRADAETRLVSGSVGSTLWQSCLCRRSACSPCGAKHTCSGTRAQPEPAQTAVELAPAMAIKTGQCSRPHSCLMVSKQCTVSSCACEYLVTITGSLGSDGVKDISQVRFQAGGIRCGAVLWHWSEAQDIGIAYCADQVAPGCADRRRSVWGQLGRGLILIL